jgi:hypothetical protein
VSFVVFGTFFMFSDATKKLDTCPNTLLTAT